MLAEHIQNGWSTLVTMGEYAKGELLSAIALAARPGIRSNAKGLSRLSGDAQSHWAIDLGREQTDTETANWAKQQLSTLSDQKEMLERRLAAALPEFARELETQHSQAAAID